MQSTKTLLGPRPDRWQPRQARRRSWQHWVTQALQRTPRCNLRCGSSRHMSHASCLSPALSVAAPGPPCHPPRAAAVAQEELRWQQMQSRQTFMAAMGGVDPGDEMEGYGEYDEARRCSPQPSARPHGCVARRARAQCPFRRTKPSARPKEEHLDLRLEIS